MFYSSNERNLDFWQQPCPTAHYAHPPPRRIRGTRSSPYELCQSGRCHFGDGAAHLASTVHPVPHAQARPTPRELLFRSARAHNRT